MRIVTAEVVLVILAYGAVNIYSFGMRLDLQADGRNLDFYTVAHSKISGNGLVSIPWIFLEQRLVK